MEKQIESERQFNIVDRSNPYTSQSIQSLVFPRGKLARFVRTDGQRAGKIHFVQIYLF